ncbi:MAG: DNA polymerase III subunit alpha [Succinivibrio sp.]|nr:DNA polymerase III subunit alpha [Succinivibrio sp.]
MTAEFSTIPNALDYIPLHLRSCYSINDGLQNVGEIVKCAAKMGFPALAVTDFNNMAGFVRFYNACLDAGVKPIMGADLQVYENTEQGEKPRKFMLTVLATDWAGKNSLYELLSHAWLKVGLNAPEKKNSATELENSPDINEACCRLEHLAKFSDGLIILDGFRGDLAAYNQAHNTKAILDRVAFYQQHFGDRFCLEITRTGRNGEKAFENFALSLCEQYNIAPVASNDTRFLYSDAARGEDGFSDYEVHDVRVSIQEGIPRGSQTMAERYSPQQYLRSQAEMRELFSDLPEALENTRLIAMRCNIKDPRIVELDKPRLPHFDTGAKSTDEALCDFAREGLKKRLDFLFPDPKERESKRPIYEKRLETELEVIIKMGFPGYFLIVQDFINWSKNHGVPVGPGRGSGGGSLVAYALRITDFDPLRFDLLFERFLNPDRISMPDFDVDFCQRNREKTINYVRSHYDEISFKHYNEISVCQIAAYGTLAAKAAIKGTGKALGMPYGQVDNIAKLIPDAPGTTFEKALGKKDSPDGLPEFGRLYERAKLNDDQEILNLINISMRLEGVIRSIGKHAAGVVISPTRLTEFSPLMLDADGKPITQYDKKDVEHAGLVKFDFLGLTTLTIIEDAMVMIRRKLKREKKPVFEVAQIPYEDAASFKTLQECETTAVFQLESQGMRNLIGDMKPDRFEDLVALVALYRPGPIQCGMVEHFVKRKHGTEQVSYPQPEFEELDLKPVLDSTYGVIVYQEQVMQLAQILAGYSLGQADILRRAMGKKDPAVMAAQKGVFKEGCIAKGRNPDIDMQIFDQVQKFAEYGFNKSHSAAYALVAWWTLWLKVHYPAEFLAAMMTADAMKTEKLITYIAECRRLNIKVNPPNVNVGEFNFGVDDQGAVIYGFAAIKGIGEDFVNFIKQERDKHGPYKDLFDFANRTYVTPDGRKLLSANNLEKLIEAGALDCLHSNRASMVNNINQALLHAQQNYKNQQSQQIDIFASLDDDLVRPALTECQPWSDNQRLYYEKSLLGLYLSGHPIDAYQTELDTFCNVMPLKNLLPGSYDRPIMVSFAGVVVDYHSGYSKRDNSKFYILNLDDSTSTFELALYGRNVEVFEAILNSYNQSFKQGEKTRGKSKVQSFPPPLVLIVEGRYYITKENKTRFSIKRLQSLEQVRSSQASQITICLKQQVFNQNLQQIKHTLTAARRTRQELDTYNSTQEENLIRGCNLALCIDNQLITFGQSDYCYIPTEQLVENFHDIGGQQCIIIS